MQSWPRAGSATGFISVEGQPQRCLERGQRHLVQPQSAHERIGVDPPDGRLGPDHDPALRPAEKLVTRKEHQIGPGVNAVTDGRLARNAWADVPVERTRADVVDGKEPVARASAPDRRAASSVKPTIWKLLRWTRRIAAVSGPIAR